MGVAGGAALLLQLIRDPPGMGQSMPGVAVVEHRLHLAVGEAVNDSCDNKSRKMIKQQITALTNDKALVHIGERGTVRPYGKILKWRERDSLVLVLSTVRKYRNVILGGREGNCLHDIGNAQQRN